MVEHKLITEFADSLETLTNFCCGGSIPVNSERRLLDTSARFVSASAELQPPMITRAKEQQQDLAVTPICLHCAIPVKDRDSRQFLLPLKDDTLNYFINAFPSPNHKITMDTTRFSITFNLYDYWIIDAITQHMLPEYPASPFHLPEQGVSVRLQTLTVHSAQGTSRSTSSSLSNTSHLGTLIVCLPHSYRGGRFSNFDKRSGQEFRLGLWIWIKYTVGCFPSGLFMGG